MFFKRANSAEKLLLNFRNASLSHCFRNSSLTTFGINYVCLITWVAANLENMENLENSGNLNNCQNLRENSGKFKVL